MTTAALDVLISHALLLLFEAARAIRFTILSTYASFILQRRHRVEHRLEYQLSLIIFRTMYRPTPISLHHNKNSARSTVQGVLTLSPVRKLSLVA